jgi:hypothetical protein
MWWREGSLERATVAADEDMECRLKTAVSVSVTCGGRTVPARLGSNGILMFAASAGTRYEITRAAGQPARPRGKHA